MPLVSMLIKVGVNGWLMKQSSCGVGKANNLIYLFIRHIYFNLFHAILLDCLTQAQNDDDHDDETGENVPMTMYADGNKFMEEFFEQVFP